jgi:hypothetical protein
LGEGAGLQVCGRARPHGARSTIRFFLVIFIILVFVFVFVFLLLLRHGVAIVDKAVTRGFRSQ